MINLFLIFRKNVFSEKTTKEKLLKIKILNLCKNKYCTSDKLLCERFHNLDSTTGIKPCNNSIIIEKINPKISFKYRF